MCFIRCMVFHTNQSLLKTCTTPPTKNVTIGVKPLIHQSEIIIYMKVVPFKEKSSFHFVVL